ncbi:MAG: hypothetical protein U0869_12990 [Chloroflexota bacterium]
MDWIPVLLLGLVAGVLVGAAAAWLVRSRRVRDRQALIDAELAAARIRAERASAETETAVVRVDALEAELRETQERADRLAVLDRRLERELAAQRGAGSETSASAVDPTAGTVVGTGSAPDPSLPAPSAEGAGELFGDLASLRIAQRLEGAAAATRAGRRGMGLDAAGARAGAPGGAGTRSRTARSGAPGSTGATTTSGGGTPVTAASVRSAMAAQPDGAHEDAGAHGRPPRMPVDIPVEAVVGAPVSADPGSGEGIPERQGASVIAPRPRPSHRRSVASPPAVPEAPPVTDLGRPAASAAPEPSVAPAAAASPLPVTAWSPDLAPDATVAAVMAALSSPDGRTPRPKPSRDAQEPGASAATPAAPVEAASEVSASEVADGLAEPAVAEAPPAEDAPHPHGWAPVRPGLSDPWTWIGERAPNGAAYGEDDLQRIHGIGPFLNKRLREEGILTYRQIAEWDDEDMTLMSKRVGSFPDRIRREDWPGSARALHLQVYGESLP